MGLNRYDIENATSIVNGYYVPRPGEMPARAFERARSEASAALRARAEHIDALTHAQYLESFKRALTRTPAGATAQRDALINLLDQLEGVGIAIRGQDEGQWQGTEGLSFHAAYSALGEKSSADQSPEPLCSAQSEPTGPTP